MSTTSPFRQDAPETIDAATPLREGGADEDETWRIDGPGAFPTDVGNAQRWPEAADYELSEAASPPSETEWMSTAPALPPFAEVLEESPVWAHRLADWRPVPREDEAEIAGEFPQEHQVPPPGAPIVSRSFSPEALAELPAVLQAKPIVRLEATVPTELILWMIQNALGNRGDEPGWADRLLVDLKDLPKAGPSSTVHIGVFQTVPFSLTSTDTLRAFERYCLKQYPQKAPIEAMSVGLYSAHRALEQQFQLPAGVISTNTGLPLQMPADQAANYKLVVYAILPPTVGRVIAPRDLRSLRNFDFGKWLLTKEHERLLDSLGREIVRSLLSRRSVTRIAADGHTDPVGTREFNIRLGQHRAEAVAARLKEIVNAYAAADSHIPAGVVERIEYVVASYGEDRPISRTLQSLNRRVEVTVYRDYRPPPQPLDEDVTLKRQTDLLQTKPTRDPDTTKRLQCLLQKMRQPGVDDRYVNDTQVFLINRDNKLPGPTEWNRVRSTLLHPDLFSPQVDDSRVITNLEKLDEDIAGGVVKMIQMIDYASGAEWGLGLLALANAFKQFNAWVMERFKDPASIYSCYAELFVD